MRAPIKIIKVGTSLAFIIPVAVCDALGIVRGEYFELSVSDTNTMLARRCRVVGVDDVGESIDNNLPQIQHAKRD